MVHWRSGMVVVFASLAMAGCVGEEPSPLVCSPDAPFTSVEPLSELATASTMELDLTLLPEDENVALFVRKPVGGGIADEELYTARRANRARLFAAPAAVVLTGGGPVASPRLVGGGLTLFFLRGSGTARRLYRATRASVSDELGAPVPVPISIGGDEIAPACLAMDGTATRALFTVDGRDGTEKARSYELLLGDTSAKPTALPIFDGLRCPVLSQDGLEAFVSRSAPDGTVEILRARRAGEAEPFEAPSPVPELAAVGEARAPTFVSRNHCDLYFTSTRDEVSRVYWARRSVP